jgi:tetratricopeptide (TPR) repeat protein
MSVSGAGVAMQVGQRISIVVIVSAAVIGFEGVSKGQSNSYSESELSCGAMATVSVTTLQVPEQAWKHFESARRLALKHKAAESERESAKALAIAPRFAAAHLLQASQELALRQFEAAVSDAAAARASEPGALWSGIILAGAYNGMHRFHDALNVLDTVEGAEAESWQAKYEHARAAVGVGDADEALSWSEEAISLAPRSFLDAMLVRANALMLAHRWIEAADQLNVYLATPAPQPHREEASRALASATRRIRAEEPVNLASR